MLSTPTAESVQGIDSSFNSSSRESSAEGTDSSFTPSSRESESINNDTDDELLDGQTLTYDELEAKIKHIEAQAARYRVLKRAVSLCDD